MVIKGTFHLPRNSGSSSWNVNEIHFSGIPLDNFQEMHVPYMSFHCESPETVPGYSQRYLCCHLDFWPEVDK